MKLLIIGSGGREHAIVWKLAQSPRVKKIYCAPGNAGIDALAECATIKPTDVTSLLDFAKNKKIDLTIVGPEAALAEGVVDRFQKAGLKIFGPTQAAAQLESSKNFTKEFCREFQIPQADFGSFTDVASAKKFIDQAAFPLVVKADGLAAGKGVTICQTYEEALAAVTESLVGQKFGSAGKRVVIEEFLQGVEASFIAIVDGKNIVPLATARDYKTLCDGNKGPNTGGMGTYSPSPLLDAAMQKKVMQKIMQPAVAGMAKRGTPFVGFLYAGLMIHNGTPKLLEFNVRLGDPETQVILTRLRTDLVDLIEEALAGRLDPRFCGDDGSVEWDDRATACIVLASKGYPESSEQGQPIAGLENFKENQEAIVFHAGTAQKAGKVVTSGGRVLGVTSWGKNVDEAARNAYSAVRKISFEGMQYRKDIGK